jgi:hypothetical protein
MRRFLMIFCIIIFSAILSGCGWNNPFWSDELGPAPGQTNGTTGGGPNSGDGHGGGPG